MLTLSRLIPVTLLSAALVSLGACAGLSNSPQVALRGSQSSDAGLDPQPTVYGEFLAGQAALNQGHAREAAEYFSRGAGLGPAAVLLKDRAFSAALIHGDVHRAAELAPEGDEGSLSSQQLGRLAKAVDALSQHRAHEAEMLLKGAPPAGAHRGAIVLLTPWAAAAAGDWKAALSLPDARGDRLVEGISRLDLALLLERRRRYDLAEETYKRLLSDGVGSGLFSGGYGAFLERRGRKADAAALYDASLKGDPSNGQLRQARDRALAGGPPPPQPTLLQGAAQALLAPAAIGLADKQQELALTYLRLVLWLDPGRDEAWLLVGDALVAAGDADGAREAYSHPKAGSPDYVSAQSRIIATYDRTADKEKTLEIAQAAAKAAPDNIEALTLLADTLRNCERYAESAAVLDKVIARQGDGAGWQLYYLRGAAFAQSDQWPAAQRDLLKALSLQPDQPDVLNFLGFSWIDRGERLKEAKEMIEKAVSAMPDSGAIVDSLGWADYKLGDYQQAVQELERAAELDAGDPDINDHLGDAYWKVGRKIEARFQWQSVLTMEPSDKLRSQVEEKLRLHPSEDGLHPSALAPTVASR